MRKSGSSSNNNNSKFYTHVATSSNKRNQRKVAKQEAATAVSSSSSSSSSSEEGEVEMKPPPPPLPKQSPLPSNHLRRSAFSDEDDDDDDEELENDEGDDSDDEKNLEQHVTIPILQSLPASPTVVSSSPSSSLPETPNQPTSDNSNNRKKQKSRYIPEPSFLLDQPPFLAGMKPMTTFIGTRFTITGSDHEINAWNKRDYPHHGQIVNVAIILNDAINLGMFALVFGSVAIGDTPLFTQSYGFVALLTIFTMVKLAVALLMHYLQKQIIVSGDARVRKREQKWPSPPIYAYLAYMEVVLYIAALIVGCIIYTQRDEYTKPKVKTLEQFILTLTAIPIYSMLQQVGVQIAPQVLKL